MNPIQDIWRVHPEELWIETMAEDSLIVCDPPIKADDMTDEEWEMRRITMDHIVDVHNEWLSTQEVEENA